MGAPPGRRTSSGVDTTRLVVALAVVVAVAVGAVVLLVPAGRSVTLAGRRAVGPDLAGVGAASGRARWVLDENAKPGTAGWQITGPVSHGDIEGYADATSVSQGEPVRLYVSTDAGTYHVEAYRMGWYGGRQARLVWQSETLAGLRQAEPNVDALTNMVEARWRPSLSVTVDRSWPPGDYLFKLVADNGFAQFVPLTVRNDAGRSALLVVNAVTTWQAYNHWGGHSLYDGVDRYGLTRPEGRSKVVSFDRPYENDSGAGDFLGNELPMVSLLEKEGYDVSYWTDVDLHHRGRLLANHRAIVSLGHDEYWSKEMRDSVEAARDAGVNLAFFGANASFRAIRLAPSALGSFRRQVNYRVARDDPLYNADNSRVTVNWREPPLNRPESTMVGDYYQCNPVKADLVVADGSAWVFAGTGLRTGDRIPELVGPEYDRYDVNAPGPPGTVQVLAHSPLRCGGRSSFSDATYYSTGSGAGVFATGTNWWVSRLGSACPEKLTCPDQRVVRITRNVLDAFATGPAGPTHPSVSNLGRLPDEPGVRETTPPEVFEHQATTTTTSWPTPSGPTTSSVPRSRYTTSPTTRRVPPTTFPTGPPLPFPGRQGGP